MHDCVGQILAAGKDGEVFIYIASKSATYWITQFVM